MIKNPFLVELTECDSEIRAVAFLLKMQVSARSYKNKITTFRCDKN